MTQDEFIKLYCKASEKIQKLVEILLLNDELTRVSEKDPPITTTDPGASKNENEKSVY